MNKYFEIKLRKDVTVKNMLKLYDNDKRYRNKITWDCVYLITGWKHIPITKENKNG
tara:strand:+ start:651 stop:818 length:168 start_codon:yes stop_codon:yes gene_type:complete